MVLLFLLALGFACQKTLPRDVVAQATTQAQATPTAWAGIIGNWSLTVFNAEEAKRLPWAGYPRETPGKFLVVDLRGGPFAGTRPFYARDVTLLAVEGSRVATYRPFKDRMFTLDSKTGRAWVFVPQAAAPGRFWLVFEVLPDAHTYRLSIWNPVDRARGTLYVPLGGPTMEGVDPSWPVEAVPPLRGDG